MKIILEGAYSMLAIAYTEGKYAYPLRGCRLYYSKLYNGVAPVMKIWKAWSTLI